jgi:hypothetical protein
MPKPAYHRPALAPAPVPSGGRGLIARIRSSLSGGSETGLSTRASSGSASPVGFAKPRHRTEISAGILATPLQSFQVLRKQRGPKLAQLS